jgi:signal transduction histidine kinase
MRGTYATALAVPLLLLLLTWLSLRAANTDADVFDRALGMLDDVAMVESDLHRDVLRARAGVSRNYDPLVLEVNAFLDLVGRLREAVAKDPEMAAAVARLAARVDRQEALVERFKSDNALLQNSLAYFGRFSTDLEATARDEQLASAVGALAAAMLRLTLDTSPQTAHVVADRLHEVTSRSASSGDTASVQALLAHARLLHGLLPMVDHVLQSLFAAPNMPERDAIRQLVIARQSASRATASVFRLLLYFASLVLVTVLIYLGARLRAGALALRRRAALEHTVAGICSRFVNVQAGEIDASVEQALADLANCVRADRAYFVRGGATTHTWRRHGIAYPPGWPEKAASAMAAFDPTPTGVIDVGRVAAMSDGDEKEVLKSAGVEFWACVSSLAGDEVVGALGFDALRAPFSVRPDEFALLRMAVDAIANAIKRDILERERARLETDLQRARRVETIGALTSGIAHNFNNIVGAILGHAELAEAQIATDSRPARNLGAIRRAAERGRDLVDQLLTFGRRRDARRSPVAVGELISEAASLLGAALPAGIELVVRDGSEGAIVSGEATQLQQVILNLCNNAAQAMDGRGRVEVRTEVRRIAGAQSLSHGDLAPGRYVQIVVSDEGRGMDRKTLERLFEPFFTTRQGGNGLGLASAREIVREHAGAINVDSAPDAGSRFEVWLPCMAAAGAPQQNEVKALPLGNGETLLVVDDEREHLLRDEEILAALGYEPIGFVGAHDALNACREAPGRFDGVVIGHFARARLALDLAAKLHAIAPTMPILLAAAPVPAVGANALIAAGISDVIAWPFASSEIASALKDCLAIRRPSPQARRTANMV